MVLEWNHVDGALPGHQPTRRTSAAMADDPATGQLILFGGYVAGGGGADIYNDTWNWNGTDWIQLSPTEVPPASEGASMAYDTAASQFILYGGEGDGVGYDATYYWNGTNWTPTDFVNGGFQGGAGDTFASPLTYDPVTGQFLLFEGGNGQGPDGPGIAPPPPAVLNETWTWNGSIWTQLAPASSPSPREAASMAYDSATNQLILFGGQTEGAETLYNDTWVWGAAPAITSAASYAAPGSPFTFKVTTTGVPTPAISLASGSSLPTGVSLTDDGDGTATLAGASMAAPGVYTFTIQAANGITPDATQPFTLTVGDVPVTSVLVPSNGTTLSGSTYLDASASGATSVEFLLFGGTYGYSAPVVCTATATAYGWLCSWNTTTVPNGSYALVSEASGAGGSAFSTGVSITVDNPPPPTTSVLIPSNGATLSGTAATLDASASNASSIEFWLFGGSYGYSGHLVGTATPTYYGWLYSWNTTTVPNGSYALLSEAFGPGGSAFSSHVSMTVKN